MDLGMTIAENLKALREERNLSIGQLSKMSGVSKAMLSELEKGGSNPTINTLWKIANAMNVHYTRLTEQKENGALFVKKEDSVLQSSEDGKYRIRCYFPSTTGRDFELFHVELDENSSHESSGHPNGSEEYIYVISGQLNLKTAAGSYLLHAGDALSFDPAVSHTYINEIEFPLSMMIINYYPA